MSQAGWVHSIQTMGTLDGPGVRFVVFTQGCNLRCGCCHNPDTWERQGGIQYDAVELAERATRYREYFGDVGGVTVSGGEPLLQAGFVKAFFEACHERGMNTCLDTSGSILDDEVKVLLSVTDRVLLDIKYPTDEQYRAHVGCGIDTPLAFLDYLNEQGIATTLRQVIIPTLNDNEQNIAFLKELIATHPCIDTVELLPFKKICTVKYEQLGLPFRFEGYDEPSQTMVARMQAKLQEAIL
ncbi:MAG: pyruvate formate lyase-activating protein [Ruminococcaceae bacterium]|nr:pyruvate formate lyase-activating protein [Oscillospiraceae bacterium]